ncbi:hypothetical protein LWI28_022162 [Acer negundo]|uniref:Reverse transcriptase zinc-binding domain-containing protein n=1 Tax=Acer negundo TaxID=4023 RepID=A0AAD5JGY7_ACENE|nr:hypothetical protein LWI28_022162 [Acer negundo]
MPTYNPNSDLEDSIRWLPSSNGIYSAFSALASLKAPHPLVPWFKLVWFPQNILRMSFILWMAVRGRLSTRDRIHKYDPRAVTTCVLCNSHLESHAHLFFECSFSRAIWTQLLNYCGSLGMALVGILLLLGLLPIGEGTPLLLSQRSFVLLWLFIIFGESVIVEFLKAPKSLVRLLFAQLLTQFAVGSPLSI